MLAHELGHFKRHHVWKRIAVLFAASFALLWVLGQLIDQPWFYAGLNVTTMSTATALLLFVLVTPVFTFFLQPLRQPAFAPARVRGRRLRGGRTRAPPNWCRRWSSSTRTTRRR